MKSECSGSNAVFYAQGEMQAIAPVRNYAHLCVVALGEAEVGAGVHGFRNGLVPI